MPNRYPVFVNLNYAYFVTFTIVDWLPMFDQHCYRQIILDSLAFLRKNKRTQLNAFVVMAIHMHAVFWPESGVNLADIVRDFKRFTSRSITKMALERQDHQLLDGFRQARQLGRAQSSSTYQVWQEGSHPDAIFTSDFAVQKINYIHQNPVRSELVSAAEEWQWSSARAYLRGEMTYPETDVIEF